MVLGLVALLTGCAGPDASDRPLASRAEAVRTAAARCLDVPGATAAPDVIDAACGGVQGAWTPGDLGTDRSLDTLLYVVAVAADEIDVWRDVSTGGAPDAVRAAAARHVVAALDRLRDTAARLAHAAPDPYAEPDASPAVVAAWARRDQAIPSDLREATERLVLAQAGRPVQIRDRMLTAKLATVRADLAARDGGEVPDVGRAYLDAATAALDAHAEVLAAAREGTLDVDAARVRLDAVTATWQAARDGLAP